MNTAKTTTSGKLLELEIFPECRIQRTSTGRARKENKSSQVQKNHNDNLSAKKVVRMVNANFEQGDYLVTLTFDPACAPVDYDNAHRCVINFLRRLKRYYSASAKKAETIIPQVEQALSSDTSNEGLIVTLDALRNLRRPFKYIYVIAIGEYETGLIAGQISYHVHMFVTGGLDQGKVENLWKYGKVERCEEYQPDRYGPEDAAKYLAKNKVDNRRFSHSNNFLLPLEEKSERGIRYFDVLELCEKRIDDRSYWEHRFPGYRFIRAEKRFNDFNSKWYLTVVMFENS